MKWFIIVFLAQIFNYLTLVVNFRAIAAGDYVWTGISDLMIASFSFFIIRRISKSDDSFFLWVGYTLGSVVGSLLGLFISKNYL